MTNLERYTAREIKMQTFRWVTPGMLFVMAVVVGLVGWLLIDEVGQIRTSIMDLKSDETTHYTTLWAANSSLRNKIECVQTQQAKCCKDSIYCV